MAQYSKSDQAEAVERLRELLKPGDTVYTILRSCSRSGMSRHISLVVHSEYNGKPTMFDISWLVARAGDYRLNRDDGGLVVSGCGMDMGFDLVYNLGRDLWPNGYECPGKHCQSNAHTNGDRDYTPHKHNDGGYALKHSWL